MLENQLQPTHRLNIPQDTLPILSGHLNLGGINPCGETIALTSYSLLRNGQPYIPVMGEFQFSRYAQAFWEDELLKMKAGGIDMIATYVFWIHIEEEAGIFDWSGNKNLREFVQLCAKHGLQCVVRLGPFAHGECRNGGLPDWLYGQSFTVRSNDEDYLCCVRRLYEAIAAQLEGLLFKDGGPVIGVQLENEYMHAGAPWEVTVKQQMEFVPAGTQGIEHMQKLKTLAQEAGLDVPLYTCTGWLNSPVIEGEMLPMQGGYAFTPWSPDPAYRQAPTKEFVFGDRHLNPVRNGAATYDASKYPYVCCEIGSGIQDTYYHRNIVPPQSVEAMAVMNLAGGANLIGYYMYHGGSHPTGKHSFMNEFTVPRISYDFQAPLREFGQMAESYQYLRLLHLFLHDFGDLLAPMNVALPDNVAAILPENTTDLRYAARAKDGAGFIFINNYQDHVEMQDLTDIQLALQVEGETLVMPHSGGLTLGKNVTAVLPFGLSLSGVRLKYATTQLLSKIEKAGHVDYVFFAPDRMLSEYAFDPATYHSIAVTSGEVIETGPMTCVVVTPGTDCVIGLEGLDGNIVQIMTLTRQQAEQCTKQVLWGEERLVITPGLLMTDEERCFLYSTGEDELSVLVYPAVTGQLTSPYGKFLSALEGVFTRYTGTLPRYEVAVSVEMIAAHKAELHFPPELFQGVNEVYLSIDYVGDVGNAFIDGKLVHDNFYNGTAWEIGLKHFADLIPEKPLLILINPLKQGSGTAHYIPTGMAFQHVSGEDEIAIIKRVTLVPEHKIQIDWLPDQK